MFLNRIYYQLKPVIPWHLRMFLRRHRAQKILKTSGDIWPINEAAGKKPKNWPGWPNKKKIAFVLTHDVESQKGLDQVQQLAELEIELNLRSSFNFIPEGNYRVSDKLLEWLVENGFEVGVHDLHHNGHLYSSQKEFKRKAKKINHYLKEWKAVGFRSGFMFRKLDWLHNLNIKYDASTFDTDPFEPQPGGEKTIFPFFVENSERKNYVELPYTLPQDSTLYLTLSEKTIDVWRRKLRWVAEKEGMALINIHPDYIDFDESKASRKQILYRRVFGSRDYPIGRIREIYTLVLTEYRDDFWNPLPMELADWFKASFDDTNDLVGQVIHDKNTT